MFCILPLINKSFKQTKMANLPIFDYSKCPVKTCKTPHTLSIQSAVPLVIEPFIGSGSSGVAVVEQLAVFRILRALKMVGVVLKSLPIFISFPSFLFSLYLTPHLVVTAGRKVWSAQNHRTHHP